MVDECLKNTARCDMSDFLIDGDELYGYIGINEDVIIPDCVKTIGSGAFINCDTLKSVVIPETVTKIGTSAFCNCINLEKIVIPDSIEEIPDYMFSGCESLRKMILSDKIRYIGRYAFNECSNLRISVPENVETNHHSFDFCQAVYRRRK